MERTVQISHLENGILLVTLDMPGSGANILSDAMLTELEQALTEINETTQPVSGLVLISAKPKIFVAGANLKEIHAALDWPDEKIESFAHRGRRIYDAFGQFEFPSVAAIHGACVGGGLELALGCNRRIATTDRRTVIGLPETKLGLIPGWAGTVRVPRIVGLETGLELVVSGQTFSSTRAMELGLVNATVDDQTELLDAACKMIQSMNQDPTWKDEHQKTYQPVPADASEIKRLADSQNNNTGFAQQVVTEHILTSCVLDFESACASEARAFAKTWGSDESHGLLNNYFLGEHNRKQPGFVDLSVMASLDSPIQKVGILGAGMMGSGIAASCVKAKLDVVILDQDHQLAQSVVDSLSCDQAHAITEYTGFTDCDLVIETVVESVPIKKEVLAKIEAVVPPTTILATNTSAIPVGELAADLEHPQRCCGIHFCNPQLMQLVEVISADATDAETTAAATAFVRGLRKTAVVVRDGAGFVVNRILSAMLDQACRLLSWGHSVAEIDDAMVKFGFRAGPFQMIDIIGAETCMNAGQVMSERGIQCINDSPIIPRMVKRKRLGRKTGRGFYLYDSADPQSSAAKSDPELDKLLEAFCQASPANETTPPSIADQILSAMLIEATRILDEQLVADPRDIDLCLIQGLGFPAAQGGLLFWAKRKPVQSAVETLNWLSKSEERFVPTDLLMKGSVGL